MDTRIEESISARITSRRAICPIALTPTGASTTSSQEAGILVGATSAMEHLILLVVLVAVVDTLMLVFIVGLLLILMSLLCGIILL